MTAPSEGRCRQEPYTPPEGRAACPFCPATVAVALERAAVRVAAIFLREMADRWAWIWLSASITFAFVGALAWSLVRRPS